jgi:hypothetical protein
MEVVMSIKPYIALLSLVASAQSEAFTCYVTLVKDSCWTSYNVTVDVLEAASDKTILTMTVPEGKSWVRESFNCEPGQKLVYRAQFSPVFWESEKGKTYPAKSYWSLPGTINAGETAWEVPICYPEAFAAVPLPPKATSNCRCDFSAVPALKP